MQAVAGPISADLEVSGTSGRELAGEEAVYEPSNIYLAVAGPSGVNQSSLAKSKTKMRGRHRRGRGQKKKLFPTKNTVEKGNDLFMLKI
ncbi:hypothetical protein JTB14_024648 [Gonioctena quinquepunctata]|nr:hypothetical protein JTB14_024648 [Gonioctena quinquepunctata]